MVDPSWRNAMYYRYWMHQSHRPAHFGIRTNRYKLAFYYGLPLGMNGVSDDPAIPGWEFFDLLSDPGENNNAYNDHSYHQIIDSLKKELIQLKKLYNDTDENYQELKTVMEKYW